MTATKKKLKVSGKNGGKMVWYLPSLIQAYSNY